MNSREIAVRAIQYVLDKGFSIGFSSIGHSCCLECLDRDIEQKRKNGEITFAIHSNELVGVKGVLRSAFIAEFDVINGNLVSQTIGFDNDRSVSV